MADVRETFTVLEDASTQAGVAWPARAEGDAVAGNHAPVVVAKDPSGQYQLLPIQAEGSAVTGNEVPTLPGKEQGGNWVHIAQATEGEAVAGDETPVLPCKDSSGNWAHIPLSADNKIAVTSEESGTGKFISGNATPGALLTDTTVATLTLTASESYKRIKMSASSSRTVLWTLVATDDATDTELARGISGPGDYSFEYVCEDIIYTAGATGTQEINLVGNQLYGPLSDMHGIISALEIA